MIARWRERLFAVAAAFLLPAALRLVSLPDALALCDRWPAIAMPPVTPHALACRVRRWLAYGRGPWTSSCLTRSLVLYAMLRQHGYQPCFFIGVSGKERDFGAHAWITLDGTPVADRPSVIRGYHPLLSHGA